jgi:hypothetical protein
MWHKSTGKIVYDPPRPGMKRRTQGWCVVNVDREITRYYRWLICKNVPGLRLHAPAWDAHISIVRGERLPEDLKHLWKRYHKHITEFEYSHEVYQNGHFWFVKVRAPHLKAIRDEFRLPSDWSLHLTVGRTWDEA